MLNRIVMSALALAIATPALAAEPTAEKPKCECCEKKEGEAKKSCCCCDKDNSASEAAQGDHKEHAGH